MNCFNKINIIRFSYKVGGQKNEHNSVFIFFALCNLIMRTYRENQKQDSNWRGSPFFDWVDEETRIKNICTMQDEWIKLNNSSKPFHWK